MKKICKIRKAFSKYLEGSLRIFRVVACLDILLKYLQVNSPKKERRKFQSSKKYLLSRNRLLRTIKMQQQFARFRNLWTTYCGISDRIVTIDESIGRTTREALDSLVPARLIQESDMKWRPAQVYVYLIERVSQPPKKEKEGGRESAARGTDRGRKRARENENNK